MAGPKVPREDLEKTPPTVRRYIDVLEDYIAQLENEVLKDSHNSSRPPSSDRYPIKREKKTSGRFPGGQPGHMGVTRTLQVPDSTIEYAPETCIHCGVLFREDAPVIGKPLIRQQAELAEKPVLIVQREYHQRKCPCCGRLSRASPAPGEEQWLGPRLKALANFLTTECHVSNSKTTAFFSEGLGVTASTGTWFKTRAALSEALTHSAGSVFQAVQTAPEKNVDETSWKQGAQREYLWTISTANASFYAILPSRGGNAAQSLLGEKPVGKITTDRFVVYDFIPPAQHAYCWSHLDRDFQWFAEREDCERRDFGKQGLRAVDALFTAWRRWRDGETTEWEYEDAMNAVRRRIGKLKWKGLFAKHPEIVRFARRLKASWESLFLFARHHMDPTNNAAERALRPGVIWRKITMGTRTDDGSAYVSRALSAVETCKKQGRPVMPFLVALLRHHQHGIKTPPVSVFDSKLSPQTRGRG